LVAALIQTKSRRLKSFARIFSRMSESNTKSSRIVLSNNAAMAALAMVVSVDMAIVHLTDPAPMVVAMEEGTTTHLLRTRQVV
jgi:hypothetical protein